MSVYDVFQGTTPHDYVAGLHVVSSRIMGPPGAFRRAWSDMGAVLRDVPRWLERSRAQVFLLICDVSDEAQRHATLQLAGTLMSLDFWQPVFLYPIASQALQHRGAVRELSLSGFHHVIAGEPRGYALALAISAAFAKVCLKLECVTSSARQRAANAQLASSYRRTVRTALWHFVPQHFGLVIPPLDVAVDRAEGKIAGYVKCELVGEGRHAQVYKVQPPAGTVSACPRGEVVKAIAKEGVRTLEHLRALDRSCRVMNILRVRWYHPSIARLLEVYNGQNHLYLRMEQAGDEDLYERLGARDSGHRPLSSVSIRSLVAQFACVIDHLHTGPRVCHRDLKPENVMLSHEYDAGGITAKLIDFDFAAVQPRGKRSRVSCGTVPFMAPEVLGSSYDGMKADMWSLGVLLLDLGCHLKTVEQEVLGVSGDDSSEDGHCPAFEAAQRLSEAFARSSTVRDIIHAEGARELAPLLPWYTLCAQSLCMVSPEQRVNSDALVAWLARHAVVA